MTGLNTSIATLSGATDPTSRMRLGGLQNKLRQDQMALQNLNAYGPALLAGGGGSDLNLPKIDSMYNTFNIHSTDPKAVADEVEKFMSSAYTDTATNFSTGRKS